MKRPVLPRRHKVWRTLVCILPLLLPATVRNTCATTYNVSTAADLKAKLESTVVAGDVVLLAGGTYRIQYISLSPTHVGNASQPIQIQPQAGASVEIKGSQLVTPTASWTSVGSSTYTTTWPPTGQSYASPQQVFIHTGSTYTFGVDGDSLQQIGDPTPINPTWATTWDYRTFGGFVPVPADGSDPIAYVKAHPGTFRYDYPSRTLYVHLRDNADPDFRAVEVSTEAGILKGDNIIDGYFTFRNLRFRHSSSFAYGRIAGLNAGNHSTFVNCDIGWFDFVGIGLRSYGQAIGCNISNNGNTGGTGDLGFLFSGCTATFNNYRLFDTSVYAAGFRLHGNVGTDGARIENCDIESNYAPGIWFDSCPNLTAPVTIVNNLIKANPGGLAIELSDNIHVFNNLFIANTTASEAGAAIFVEHGENNIIANNLIKDSTKTGTAAGSAVYIGGNNALRYQDVPGTPICQALIGNRFLNNIMHNNSTTYDLRIFKDQTRAGTGGTPTRWTNNLADYNIYYRSSGSLANGLTDVSAELDVDCQTSPNLQTSFTTTYTSMTSGSWQSTGHDAHGYQVFTGNPLFLVGSGTDFRLNPSAVAIDNGVPVAGVDDDYDGTGRIIGSAIDIGPFEFWGFPKVFPATNKYVITWPRSVRSTSYSVYGRPTGGTYSLLGSTSGDTWFETTSWAGAGADFYVAASETGNTSAAVSVNTATEAIQTPVIDNTTSGTWKGHYGGMRPYIPGDSVSPLPPNDSTYTFSTTGTAYTWTSTTDPRALQRVASSDRVASAWYAATSFNVDIQINDLREHEVALYFMDWDGIGAGRNETVAAYDGNTGALLVSPITVSSFASGRYIPFKIRGKVEFRITAVSGGNAILNALFVDIPVSATLADEEYDTQGNWNTEFGTVTKVIAKSTTASSSYSVPFGSLTVNGGADGIIWESPTTDIRGLKTQDLSSRLGARWENGGSPIQVTTSFNDDQRHQVSLYFVDWDTKNTRKLHIDVKNSSSPNEIFWSRDLYSFQSGRYLSWNVKGSVTIVVSSLTASPAVLSGVFVDAPTSFVPLALDSGLVSGGGAWIGKIGSQGCSIVYDGDIAVNGIFGTTGAPYAWAPYTTAANALQYTSGIGGLAACWYAAQSFTWDVSLLDGLSHKLSWYALDWDGSNGRKEIFRTLDVSTGDLLDTPIATFTAGKYLQYRLKGKGKIHIQTDTGSTGNAVVSGIFLDP